MFIKTIGNKSKKWQYSWWIGSYAIITVAALLINLYGYNFAISAVEKEMVNVNTKIAENTRNVYDTYFSNMQSGAYNLLYSGNMKNLVYSVNLTSAERTGYINGVVRETANMMSDRLIKNINIIIQKKDICISSGGRSNVKNTYDVWFEEYYDSIEDFKADMLDVNIMEYKFLKNKSGKINMFFVYSMKYMSGYDAVAVYEINSINLNKMIKESLGKNDEYAITDKKGNVIFSSMVLKKFADGREVKYNGVKYISNSVKSNITDINYVYLLPKNEYVKKIVNLKIRYILSFIVCIAVGILLATVFAGINYSYTSNLNKKMEEQNIQLRQNVIRNILLRRIDIYQITTEFMIQKNIFFTGKSYAVLIFDISDAEDMEFKNISDFIQNKFAEIVKNEANAYFCDINSTLVCVLNIVESDFSENRLRDMAKTLNKEITDKYGIDIVCSVSRIDTSKAEIANLYEDALENINFRLLENGSSVLLCDDSFDFRRHIYTVDDEKHMINYINTGKKDEAEKLAVNIIHDNVRRRKINLGSLKVLCTEIMQTALKVLSRDETSDENGYQRLYKYLVGASGISNGEEAENHVVKFISEVCAMMPETQDKRDDRIEKIKVFITENISDPNLSVTYVSEKFNLSRSRISTYFKESCGVGIAEFIIEKRIEIAKEMLLNSENTVTWIAEQTGFSSLVAFVRAFKRVEGITPSQYRETERR